MKDFTIYQMALRTMTPGGTLNAAADLLPFIRENGFDVVYLCPVFREDDDEDRAFWSKRQIASGTDNPKNPYKIIDYYTVDDEFGTNDDLRAFIGRAHAIGLKVWLDLVYLHCGAKAVFIPEHPDWVEQAEDGSPRVGETWPFARINYKNSGVREYLWNNMTTYVGEYGVDGFRCDVGDAVPLDFWAEGIRRCRAIDPDLVMLNEGGKADYLPVFDFEYGWGDKLDCRALLASDRPAEMFRANVEKTTGDGSFARCVQTIENHDTASDLVRFDRACGFEHTNLALFLLYTREGIPFVWNGNEIADTAENCMFANRFHTGRSQIDWSNLLRENGQTRLALIRHLNAFRHAHPMLQTAETVPLDTGDGQVVAFLRRGGSETILCVCNPSREARTVSFETPDLSRAEKLLSRGAQIDDVTVGLNPGGFLAVKLA